MTQISPVQDIDFSQWPYNFLEVLAEQVMQDMSEVEAVLFRDLVVADPSESLGLFVSKWVPESYATGMMYPEASHYIYSIRLLSKGLPREEVLLRNTLLSKKLRVMLYRPDGAILRFNQLAAESFGVMERFQRMVVNEQTFESAELDANTFVALSMTQLTVRTGT